MSQPALCDDAVVDNWIEWQHQVVAAVRAEFSGVLQDIDGDDIGWDAWRPLFDQGLTPAAAVDAAFLRAGDAS